MSNKITAGRSLVVLVSNAVQFGPGLWGGSGVPASSLGSNGDTYFRSDTPGTANQRIYIKSSGTWTGIV